jgi:glycosyltransferase involved in cell wall biosynthesis
MFFYCEDPIKTLPTISVVIPSYNQGQFIEQAITSILGQFYPNLELIIMDGDSTDNTATVIEKYKNSISIYVSEPDRGQAHAINKGFKLATGEILAWLNSDDMYLPGTMFKIASLFAAPEEPKFVYGRCITLNEAAKTSRLRIPESFNQERLRYYDFIDQPSSFWSRTLWDRVGEINETYDYVLDWDWYIRASMLCPFTLITDCLSIYRIHPSHKTATGKEKRAKEVLDIVRRYASNDWIEIYRQAYEKLYGNDRSPNTQKKGSLLSGIRYRFSRIIYPDPPPQQAEPSPMEIAISLLV